LKNKKGGGLCWKRVTGERAGVAKKKKIICSGSEGRLSDGGEGSLGREKTAVRFAYKIFSKEGDRPHFEKKKRGSSCGPKGKKNPKKAFLKKGNEKIKRSKKCMNLFWNRKKRKPEISRRGVPQRFSPK